MDDQKYWARVLLELYGIHTELDKLDGELDLNFVSLQNEKQIVLKVMRPGCASDIVTMQCQALQLIGENSPGVPIPEIILTASGQSFATTTDSDGTPRLIWVQTCLPGTCYARFSPHKGELIAQIGSHLANINLALKDFAHPSLDRDMQWRLPQADWIADELPIISDPEKRQLLGKICKTFARIKPSLDALPAQPIHNDLNDYNILVQPGSQTAASISGLIDFGDMVGGPRICDLAIAGAYVVLDHPHPERALTTLVAAYHLASPLTKQEVELLWPLLRMRLALSIIISTQRAIELPDDPYVTISQGPAWRFLQALISDTDIAARLRLACDLPIVPGAEAVKDFLGKNRGNFAPVLGFDLDNAPLGNLCVRDATIPADPFCMSAAEAKNPAASQNLPDIWIGQYAEPRLIYTDKAFFNGKYKSSDRRTVHLGVDVFAPAGQSVHAPIAGTVQALQNRKNHLDYGGLVILRHQTPIGEEFFTLYGHLDPAMSTTLKVGQPVQKGEVFGQLGTPSQNGGWDPHLHFQLALTTNDMGRDWPGVADPDDLEFWRCICPNPAALLNLDDQHVAYCPTDQTTLHAARDLHLGSNVKLSYNKPVMLLRGWRHHLFDEMGRPFLDAYNNVPHVGHAHPRIQAIAIDQLARMNSNTRYLHPAPVEFAKTILAKMPQEMAVCYFVNSGSEANELALRLARAHTGGHNMITPDHGYHGNTTGALAMSAYKFNKPGGIGQADWVHLVDIPDDYRGKYQRGEAGIAKKYATQVETSIVSIVNQGRKLAGFIAETFPSVGGQIIPPAGYLKAVYRHIRAAGGICIADEVQTGLGRLGSHYFGFETQDVIPDIIVLGKPIGNGHPLGVVVTTKAIAQSFDNGIEFFSTFGGSNLSCRIGKEVLDIVDDEALQHNALQMGELLKSGLQNLQKKHRAIGDVRGMGLFLGIDLVSNRTTKAPATQLASYVVNRLRENRILIGVEGPDNNILKIRPPLTIESDDVELILITLDRILNETCAHPAE